MITQVAQALDDTMSPEVQNHLFQEPGKKFGLDLSALNIQRGREHGVPSYNRWREWCGLPTFHAFDEMLGVMRNKTVSAYARFVFINHYRVVHKVVQYILLTSNSGCSFASTMPMLNNQSTTAHRPTFCLGCIN